MELVVVGAVFEDVEGFDEVGEFAVAVEAGVEVGVGVVDVAADGAEVGPAEVVGVFAHGAFEQGQGVGSIVVFFGGGGVGFAVAAFFVSALFFGQEDFGVDEFVAGFAEGGGGFLFAKAVYGEPAFAQAAGEAGEVGIAGYDAEAVEIAAVEQVHRVNH